MPSYDDVFQRRAFRLRLLSVLVLIGSGLVLSTTCADDTVRFPAEPWGLDTPAGQCVVCHSLEQGGEFRVAPNLWSIVDAEKARDRSWYAYSTALLNKGGSWTQQDLDAFLADADEYVPGTSKSISVRNPEERRQIIEFLKTLKN
jgi:cytochrome c